MFFFVRSRFSCYSYSENRRQKEHGHEIGMIYSSPDNFDFHCSTLKLINFGGRSVKFLFYWTGLFLGWLKDNAAFFISFKHIPFNFRSVLSFFLLVFWLVRNYLSDLERAVEFCECRLNKRSFLLQIFSHSIKQRNRNDKDVHIGVNQYYFFYHFLSKKIFQLIVFDFDIV